MRRARPLPLFAIFALFAGAPARAQWGATFDAGYSHLRQAGIPESNALTFGAGVDRLGDRTSFQSTALASRTSGERWTVQGIAGAGWLSAPMRQARLELAGLVSTFAATNALPTASTELMARARLGGTEHGAAIGVGAGTFSQETKTSPLVHVQANAWRASARDQLVSELSFVHTQAVNYPLALAAAYAIPLVLRPLSYADLSAAWRRDYGATSFGVLGGVRTGLAGDENTDGWATADATAWLTPRTALVAGIGRTLADIVRGAPSTRYVSLSIRLSARPHPSLTTRQHATSGPVVDVELSSDGRRRIVARVPSASRVEILADFTNWNPLPLEQSGARWTAERVLTPGLHRIVIRIDGGEWIVPANLPHVTDDLGGVVGLITVP